MARPTTPRTGYAFRHKTTGALSLVLYLGTGDSINNYEEITETEYERLLVEQEKLEEKSLDKGAAYAGI